MSHATKKQLAEFNMKFGAVLSDCGEYRYRLDRTWDERLTKVAFIMLNPSTADASKDDPTIRRCIRFAMDWGYGGIVVGNLFALRSADPLVLKMHGAPVGPDNDSHLNAIAAECSEVVCAWGGHGSLMNRDAVVTDALMLYELVCLKRTKDGSPGHPLYIKSTAERTPFFGKETK